MPGIENAKSCSAEDYSTEDDYYDLKRFLELKVKLKVIFENSERAKKLKEHIANKNKIKDEMTKITEDESYVKGLGL